VTYDIRFLRSDSRCWQYVSDLSNVTPRYLGSEQKDKVLLLYLTLTHIEPAYVIFVLRFRPKNSNFQLPYQRPSSSADCARELFNGSNGSGSLVDCTRKKNFLPGGCGFFVSDVISGGLLGRLGPFCLALGANR